MRDQRFLIGGVVMLAVAMGVGRFAYTPLLPVMEHDAGLSVAAAGSLAFANLLGYFTGASLAMHPVTHRSRLAVARWSIACIIVTTGLMATIPPLWLPLRFLTGVASGFVLIFSSSIVLERAAHEHRPALPPLFFSGVGLGIAFSGVAVPALAAHFGSRGAWLGIAIISALAAGPTGIWFTDHAPPGRLAENDAGATPPPHRRVFAWLIAIYTAEAFAYVIPATFLVAIIAKIPELSQYSNLAWVVVGLAGAFATFPWIRLAARFGKARALALALGIQAAGIAAPLVSTSPAAIVVAAIALGGTFMAITLFASGLARDIFPHRTSAAVSRLTVFYSIGQMIGPLAATQLALRFDSYGPALLGAALAAGLATLATLLTIRDPHHTGTANLDSSTT